MLDKKQSDLWSALDQGEQWVYRNEIANMQKADKSKSKATKETASKSASASTAAAAKVDPPAPDPKPVSPSTSAPTSSPPKKPAAARSSTPSASSSSFHPQASIASGTTGNLVKPPMGSRVVDTKEANSEKRIEFIKKADWQQLEDAVYDCTVCDIGKNRLNAVFGDGNPPCDVVLIGEGPGRVEDEQGRIFVGPSGRLLDKILASLKIDRNKDVAILNTIKCRPPQNANPSEPETAACRPFLERQVELLDPKLIVVLGRPACKWVFREDTPLTQKRGRVHEVEVAGKNRKVICTFHPSYLLRTPADKAKAWLDWLMVSENMRKIKDQAKDNT